MMKIVIGGRRSGKTTRCYRKLERNPDAVMFTISRNIADMAPEHLKTRVLSYRQCLNQIVRKPFKKVIIDEADFMPDNVLEQIQSRLEIILVTTSIGNSYTNPFTWLRKQIDEAEEIEILPTPMLIPKHLPHDQIEREFLCQFKEPLRCRKDLLVETTAKRDVISIRFTEKPCSLLDNDCLTVGHDKLGWYYSISKQEEKQPTNSSEKKQDE